MSRILCMIAMLFAAPVFAQTVGDRQAILVEEFIYQSAPFPSCHAGTIVETADGTIMAAWFGGYQESHKRVGIWTSRRVDGRWTPPVEAVNGLQADGDYLATWNPVLFQPKDGPLMLFFKVSKTPATWWGEWMISNDNGVTWTDRKKLPNDGIGPVKNKPIQLPSGEILCPSSNEAGDQWLVHIEKTSDLGKTWTTTGPLHTKDEAQAIQPSILTYKNNRLQMLCRNKDSGGKLWQCWSEDGGKTWGKFTPTVLPNPNSGTDAVTLADGRQLLIYNHTNGKSEDPDKPTGRTMLNLAVTENGTDWRAACIFENTPKAEFSYPAVIQSKDGMVHIIYTWKRQIMKYVKLDPAKIKGVPMPQGEWPK